MVSCRGKKVFGHTQKTFFRVSGTFRTRVRNIFSYKLSVCIRVRNIFPRVRNIPARV